MDSKLSQLRQLLHVLPQLLPEPVQSRYGFDTFQLDLEHVEQYGREDSALNRVLEVIITFGWKSRSEGNGIITLCERGQGICAVLDVLSKYSADFPGSPNEEWDW